MEHNIVDTLKCEAIKQTLDFFNSKHHLVLITGELEAILNKANDDIYNCIDLYNKMVFEGRTDELKQLIFKYRDGCFEVISKIKVNEMYVKNSGANNLVDDFCTCVFYDLVYESQLNELLQGNRHQQSINSNQPIDYNTQIFKNVQGFILFEKLVKICPKVNDTYSFIFLQLAKDGYVYENLSHRVIKDFFNSEPYKITIDKIKPLTKLENTTRMALYSSVLNAVK